MNKFIGIGRVTKDIEKRVTQSGKSVVSFTIAIKKDKENSDFINCVAWNHTADFMTQYVKKGDLIAIDGRLQVRAYDKSDGNKGYITEIVTNSVNLLAKTQNAKQQTEQSGNFRLEDISTDFSDEDLPF